MEIKNGGICTKEIKMRFKRDDTYCVVCGDYCGEGRHICQKCEEYESRDYEDEINSLNEKFWLPKNHYLNGVRLVGGFI